MCVFSIARVAASTSSADWIDKLSSSSLLNSLREWFRCTEGSQGNCARFFSRLRTNITLTREGARRDENTARYCCHIFVTPILTGDWGPAALISISTCTSSSRREVSIVAFLKRSNEMLSSSLCTRKPDVSQFQVCPIPHDTAGGEVVC